MQTATERVIVHAIRSVKMPYSPYVLSMCNMRKRNNLATRDADEQTVQKMLKGLTEISPF